MPVQPADLLECARELAGRSNEADWRAAASRAYYAMFHRMRAIAVSEIGYQPPQGNTSVHRHLQDALRRGSRRHRRFADHLRYSAADRIQADYDLSSLFNKATANGAVGRARAALNIPGPAK